MARGQSVAGCIAAVLAGLALAGGVGGCRSAAKAEPGTYGYSGGELTDIEAVSLDKAFSAAVSAVEVLQLRPAGQSKDALGAEVSAETIDHTPVHIKMKALGPGSTEFRVRFGLFGDREKSQSVMDQVKKGL